MDACSRPNEDVVKHFNMLVAAAKALEIKVTLITVRELMRKLVFSPVLMGLPEGSEWILSLPHAYAASCQDGGDANRG